MCDTPDESTGLVADITRCEEPATWGFTLDDGPNATHNAVSLECSFLPFSRTDSRPPCSTTITSNPSTRRRPSSTSAPTSWTGLWRLSVVSVMVTSEYNVHLLFLNELLLTYCPLTGSAPTLGGERRATELAYGRLTFASPRYHLKSPL